ncbi:hypothetical protein [Microbacterium sp. 1P10AE]|uniref:hypothetical protein n=1 Tax=Microbacterium sp. 1P10AE TaxID=3132286 RepID=UPI0039A096E2
MSILDQFRDQPARRPMLADVAQARSRAAAALTRRTRIFFWVVLVVAAAAAIAEFVTLPTLLSTAATAEGLGAVPAAILLWPVPALQPAVLSASALALVVLAARTGGFARADVVQSRTLVAVAIAGMVAVLPAVVIIAAVVAAAALVITAIVAIALDIAEG